MAQQASDRVSIEGATTEQTTGTYGDQGCEQTLHVVVEDEDVYVPFDGVRIGGYDYHGNVPDRFDVDRIILYDGHVHAEADVEGGVVELIPNYNSSTAKFRGYDSWDLEMFDAETTQRGTVVWERD